MIIIVISLAIFILIGILAYLNYTDRLNYLLNFKWNLLIDSLKGFEKWILSASLISVLLLAFFTNFISSFLYDKLYPNHDKGIFSNTEIIIEKQDDILQNVSESSEKLDELIKVSRIDFRDVEQYLKELPINKGKGETLVIVEEWYQRKKLSLEMKEILNIVVNIYFEQNKVLTDEIARLKLKGENGAAEIMENIQKAFQKGDAEKIKQEYFLRKEKTLKENIIILKQSIIATKILFAYSEAIDLHKELILLEPVAYNYLHLA